MLRIEVPRYPERIDGLPDKAWVLTNSERGASACPRRYWFAYIEGLKPKSTSKPLRYGSGWHEVMEAIYRHWMVHDSTCPWSVVSDAIDEVSRQWAQSESDGQLEFGEAEKETSRLTNAVLGWVETYGLDPYEDLKIVAVEKAFAAPVRARNGKLFRPEMFVVSDGDGGYRPARTGESSIAETVRWAFYQVGRLDALAVHRRNGSVWAIDHKSTVSPAQYVRGLSVDPQMQGYLWMVEQAIARGFVDGASRDAKIGGFIYDVASSGKQYDPAVLKNGQISQSKSKTVPSWRFIQKVADLSLDVADYEEHIAELRSRIDPKLYQREWMTVSAKGRARYGSEIFGEAKRLAGLRRSAARIVDPDLIHETHPRVPVCKSAGAFCSFKGPCSEDGELARLEFNVTDGMRWLSCDSNKPATDVVLVDPDENTVRGAERGKLGW